ncbi:hypothetical protein [Pseudonocardia zijingensis]|uniref:hypothetical protein n=1 Tax=Pseudonocardia zijingensis TaxID=153376 RepID=UPI00361E96AE
MALPSRAAARRGRRGRAHRRHRSPSGNGSGMRPSGGRAITDGARIRAADPVVHRAGTSIG